MPSVVSIGAVPTVRAPMGMTARDNCRGIGEAVKNGWAASEGKVNFPEAWPCAVQLADDFHKSAVTLEAILKVPQLQNMSQFSSFLGIGSYYQGVLPNAAALLHYRSSLDPHDVPRLQMKQRTLNYQKVKLHL